MNNILERISSKVHEFYFGRQKLPEVLGKRERKKKLIFDKGTHIKYECDIIR